MEHLQKDVSEIHRMTSVKTGPEVVDHGAEDAWTPASHQDHVHSFRQHVLDNPEAKPERGAREAGEGRTPGKRVYRTPDPPTGDHKRFLVRPYFDKPGGKDLVGVLPHPLGGWAEMTQQALYHAGGNAHLYQKVHVAHQRGTPVLVTHLEPGYESVADTTEDLSRNRPEAAEEARRIVLHHMLSNKWDAHDDNLLHRDGHPLDVDSGVAFQYREPKENDGNPHMQAFLRARGLGALATGPYDMVDPYHYDSAVDKVHSFGGNSALRQAERQRRAEEEYKPTLAWWKGARDQIQMTMDRRLRLIRDPAVRENIKRNWDARVAHLDDAAAGRAPLFGRSIPLYIPETHE